MDENKKVVAQLVSTIDIDNVQSENQDKEDIPEVQKPVILLNLSKVKTSTKAQTAQVELCLVRRRSA